MLNTVEEKNNGTGYLLPGQGCLKLSLQQGDLLTLTQPEVCQAFEFLVLDSSGCSLNQLYADYPIAPLLQAQSQLNSDSKSARRLQALLKNWAVDASMLMAGICISATAEVTLPARAEMEVIILNCGSDMAVTGQNPVAELHITHYQVEGDLPAPLATPASEIRVAHSTARSYRVKAGEWIQIIDVEGRQCSDFIAFDAAMLAQGEELCLDATGTRTLNGLSVPVPGLHSRLADSRQQAMLEVVQDTVGRHDSFLFACNSKYYEDQGYPGHISCTENFNRCLADYGVAPRAGWPAINFFFNTQAESCGEIGFAEPWSRAGDYVLLRATRDLLCVSSACPDDIDPANGWNPSDIHVRIYGAEQEFPRLLRHRVSPEEPLRMTKQTGFHNRVSDASRHLAEYSGYWVAEEYDNRGAIAEYHACREKVAMIDLSPLRKFEVLGPDAEALLQLALTRNVRRVSIGEVVYSAICHETGGMIDDGTLFRMGEQAFRWICGDLYCGQWLRELAEQNNFQVHIRDSSDHLHNLAVQGPESRSLLSQIVWNAEHQTPIAELGWFRFMVGRLGGAEGIPVMVSRTGYTGELGFEVWCHPDHAEAVWDMVAATGQQYGISPMGFKALDMLRIEAGLIFAGYEFCPETNPFEAGIGFTVPLKTNQENFIGREAIESQNPASRHRLVGLLIDSQEAVHHGDQVFSGRFPVGVVTSATFSPLLKQQIALCRMAPQYAEPESRVEVGQLDGQLKRIPAVVTTLPFYDPDRTRVRS